MKLTLEDRSDASMGLRRYNVYANGTYVGWVLRWRNEPWSAFISEGVNHWTRAWCSQMAKPSIHIAEGMPTRREALRELEWELTHKFSFDPEGAA